MARSHPASHAKRAREAAKRAKRQEKAEKKAQRKALAEASQDDPGVDGPMTEDGAEGDAATAADRDETPATEEASTTD